MTGGPQLRIAWPGATWAVAKDGDDDLRRLFDRHYSRRRYSDGPRPKLFVGPGEKLVLATPRCDALFVWRRFIDDADDGSGNRQNGVNCAIFRNEGTTLSSALILAAEPFALARWGSIRAYTYVNAERIRRKRDPDRCFRRAGWTDAGRTRGGLWILEKYLVD